MLHLKLLRKPEKAKLKTSKWEIKKKKEWNKELKKQKAGSLKR
jgi:hypothetical protein